MYYLDLSSGNRQAHTINNRKRGTRHWAQSNWFRDKSNKFKWRPMQVVGVNRLTHICCWAHNLSIAQNQAQLSSGEIRANQITFFYLFYLFFIFEKALFVISLVPFYYSYNYSKLYIYTILIARAPHVHEFFFFFCYNFPIIPIWHLHICLIILRICKLLI